jgi:gliding motility-associated protein GldE
MASSLVTGCEVAFYSLSSNDVDRLKEDKDRISKLILKYDAQPYKLLSTFIVLKTILFIGIIIFSTRLVITLVNNFNLPAFSFIIEIVVLTYLVLLFNERIPLGYFRKYPAQTLHVMIVPMHWLTKVLKPIYFILPKTIKEKRNLKRTDISIEELSELLDLESTKEKDSNILNGIMRFGDIDVKEIMRSRMDVTAIDINIGFDKLFETITESGYSRLPVYEDNFDNIKGILYIKDLLPSFKQNNKYTKWQTYIRPAYYVPENKKINDLLKGFQQNKTHMAIVNDEYGGTYGIVTMEDILEEIVGEITDESEEDEINYSKLDENNYLFDGKVLINDFYKVLDIKDDIFDGVKGDADTIAGLILNLKGEMPRSNEVITYDNFVFKIEAVDKRRIKQIKVTIRRENESKNEV